MQQSLTVRDDAELRHLVERLQRSERIALDTEFLRERTYYPKLCLLQVATEELLAIVDPLAGVELAPLLETLTGDQEIVVHAGLQDLEILHGLTGRLPRRLFDTQVAAGFVGLDSISYARLVEVCCSKSLKPSEAYTNWERRPLLPEQEAYALDDVRYLLDCHDWLRQQLSEKGRVAWATEELEGLRQQVEQQAVDPGRRWRKVENARHLRGRHLATLRELARWREEQAQRRNVPRQRVVPDRALVKIARREPRMKSELAEVRGLNPQEIRRTGDAILAAVCRGLEQDPDSWPRWPRASGHLDGASIAAIATLLAAFVRSRSRSLQISARLLATRKDLESLVRSYLSGSTDGPLRGWRQQVIGRDLLRLLEGETHLRIVRQGETLAIVARMPES